MPKIKDAIYNSIRSTGITVCRTYRIRQASGEVGPLGLAALLTLHAGEIVLVQVGAADGTTNDPLHRILSQHMNRVRAVLIDPIPAHAESLRNLYRDHPNVSIGECAITSRDGEVEMQVPVDGDRQKSTLVEGSRKYWEGRGVTFESMRVRGQTMASLLEEQKLTKIDFLQVDAEGLDDKIVKWTFDCSVFPAMINLEFVHFDRNTRLGIRELLRSKGYLFVEGGMDCFAWRKELEI